MPPVPSFDEVMKKEMGDKFDPAMINDAMRKDYDMKVME